LIFRLPHLSRLDRRGARAIGMLAQLCRERRTLLILSGVQHEAWGVLGHEGVLDEVGPRNVLRRWSDALERAREFLGTQ
jgi:hypothetical protein